MKTLLKIVLVSLLLFSTSCKKEKTVEPTPATPAATVMVPVTLKFAFADDLSRAGTFVTPTVKILDASGNLDTVLSGFTVTSAAGPLFSGPCGLPGLAYVTYNTSVPDGGTIRMLVYSGTTKLVDYRINQTAYMNDSLTSTASCTACIGNHDWITYW